MVNHEKDKHLAPRANPRLACSIDGDYRCRICLPEAGLDLSDYKNYRQHLYFWHARESDDVLRANNKPRELIVQLPLQVKCHLGTYLPHREMMKKHLRAIRSASTIEVYAKERAPKLEGEYQESLKAKLMPRRRLGNGKKKQREQQEGNKAKVKKEARKRKRDAEDSDFDEEATDSTIAKDKKKACKKAKINQGPFGTQKRSKTDMNAASKVKAE